MKAFFDSFISLSLEAAPWLVLGMLIAGLIKAWVPMQRVRDHLGGKGIVPIFKAALLGAPLPLCSCSVIPVTLELRRSGASPSATVSFLVSTPETGADSISVSYALLGPFMAVIRPIAAISSAVMAGVFTLIVGEGKTSTDSSAQAPISACCAGEKTEVSAEHDNCCSNSATPEVKASFWQKTFSGVQYGFTDVWNDMAVWLLVGLLFAAAVDAFIPPAFLLQWGNGPIAMVVMMLVGVPMYICATASTPIAAGLLLAGVSPGTVLVFLLAGPATNMATLGLVRKEMGSRVLAAYLLGIGITSLLFGMLTDFLVALWQLDIQGAASNGHDMVPAFITYGTSAFLLLLTIRFIAQKWKAHAHHSHEHSHSH